MSAASVNRTMRSLKAALNLAARHSDALIDTRPWTIGLASIANADRSKHVILPEPVIAAIVAAARQHSIEFGNLVQVLAETGARFSQVTRCEVADLVGEDDKAVLSIPVSRKGRGVKQVRAHALPISAGLATRLKIAAGNRLLTEPLLLRADGNPWRHTDETKLFRRAVIAAGQDPSKVSAYALRHSWIVGRLRAGVAARLVAVMADTSLIMLERTYSRFIDQGSDAVMRAALPRVELETADVEQLRS